MVRVSGFRPALRLLFVLLIAAGITGMHTLGHGRTGGHNGTVQTADQHHQSSAMDEPAVTERIPSLEQLLTQSLQTRVIGVVDQQAIADGMGMGMNADPTSVCLAVVVAFGLAVLIAVLLATAKRIRAFVTSAYLLRSMAGRKPPTPVPLGLRLADLSVLRI